MNCANHPNVNAVSQCNTCGTALCGICTRYDGDTVLCERCEKFKSQEKYASSLGKKGGRMGDLVSKDKTDHRQTAASSKPVKHSPDGKEKMLMGIVIVSTLFIGFQIFTSLGSGGVMTATEIQAQDRTRNQIADCMLVFWEIAGQLANGRQPSNSLRCAETGLPMEIIHSDGDILVRHPRPDLLGLTDIYVTRSNPTPIVVN